MVKNKALLILIIASFILPLGYSFLYRIEPVVDAQAYDRIAVNLISGNGFKEDASKTFKFDTAIVRAGPGYEFFLAGIYEVFDNRYEAVWIVQAILHALSALLLFVICCRLFSANGETVGLITAGIFGLHPDLIEISAMLMTETVYLFLIILAVYIFVRSFEKSKSLILAAFLGLTIGFAILTRLPVALFIPVIIWMYAKSKSYRSAAVFLGAMIVILAPWTIRNYLIFHQFIPTTLIGSYNVWIGNRLGTDGGQIAGGFNPVTAYTDIYGFFGLKAKANAEFWSFISGHPFLFIKLCAIRVVRYFSLIRPMGFWFYQTGSKQLIFVGSSFIAIAVLFISGFSGMLIAMRERRAVFYYLSTFAAIAPLVLIPTVVQSRYRFQIYPFLSIFGGYYIVQLYHRFPNSKKILAGVVGVLIFISLLDAIAAWPIIIDRFHHFIV